MKVFAIVHYLAGDSGHKVTVVKAETEFEAGTKYVKEKCKSIKQLGMIVTEITEDVQTVLEYDNPNYEGKSQ